MPPLTLLIHCSTAATCSVETTSPFLSSRPATSVMNCSDSARSATATADAALSALTLNNVAPPPSAANVSQLSAAEGGGATLAMHDTTGSAPSFSSAIAGA